MKLLLSSIAGAVLVVTLTTGSTLADPLIDRAEPGSLFAQLRTTPLAKLKKLSPPSKEGCYRLSGTAWHAAPCLTDKYISTHYPHPNFLPAIVLDKADPPANPHERSLGTGDQAALLGLYDEPESAKTKYLKLIGVIPWSVSPYVFSIVVKDKYSLTRNVNKTGMWTEAVGSILGYGNGSLASFKDTKLEVAEFIAACQATGSVCGFNTGTGTWQSTKPVAHLSAGTGEGNNLKPTVNFGPTTTTGIPDINCTVYHCNMSYSNTTD
jgi:hypothetical protein